MFYIFKVLGNKIYIWILINVCICINWFYVVLGFCRILIILKFFDICCYKCVYIYKV